MLKVRVKMSSLRLNEPALGPETVRHLFSSILFSTLQVEDECRRHSPHLKGKPVWTLLTRSEQRSNFN